MPPPPTTTPQPPAHLAAESTFTTNLRAALRAQTTWHAYIRAGGYSGARRILSEQEFNAFRDGMQPFDRCGFERRVCEMEEGPRGRVRRMEKSAESDDADADAVFAEMVWRLDDALEQLSRHLRRKSGGGRSEGEMETLRRMGEKLLAMVCTQQRSS